MLDFVQLAFHDLGGGQGFCTDNICTGWLDDGDYGVQMPSVGPVKHHVASVWAPSAGGEKALATFPMTADGVNRNLTESTIQGPLTARGVSVIEPLQLRQPRLRISKASPSHLVLAGNALVLASVQGVLSGDMRGKNIQENAAANASALSPTAAYLLRKSFAVESDMEKAKKEAGYYCPLITLLFLMLLCVGRKEGSLEGEERKIEKIHMRLYK